MPWQTDEIKARNTVNHLLGLSEVSWTQTRCKTSARTRANCFLKLLFEIELDIYLVKNCAYSFVKLYSNTACKNSNSF